MCKKMSNTTLIIKAMIMRLKEISSYKHLKYILTFLSLMCLSLSFFLAKAASVKFAIRSKELATIL